MIEHRPFASLGHEKLEWLDTHHHFSFAGYRDQVAPPRSRRHRNRDGRRRLGRGL
jgi:hypothetical protein